MCSDSQPNNSWKLLFNPVSLKVCGPNVRGVITPSGDLYLENQSNGTIHNDILKTLTGWGVLPGPFRRNWTRKLPIESGFLTVQRYKDTDVICIGESNRLLYTKAGYEEHIAVFRQFLEAARANHPGITFVDKLVRIKPPFRGDAEVVYGFGY